MKSVLSGRVASLLLALCFLCLFVRTDACATARIAGTVFQLSERYTAWSQDDWQKLFLKFKLLNFNQIIIQWTVYDTVDFSTQLSHDGMRSVLDQVLKLCADHGLDVYVGLLSDPEYWHKVEQGVVKQKAYLQQHYEKTVELAKRLQPDLMNMSVFKGWYISEEIDDINWQEPDSAKVLYGYLQHLCLALKKLTPEKVILISGFSNALQSPDDLEKFWALLLLKADIDRVLFQDGIGVHKLTLEQLPEYFAAVRDAAALHDVEFQVITEIFTQTGGYPLDSGPFRAQPASQERIRRQLQVAGDFTNTTIAFSVPEYMSSLDGLQAGEIFINPLQIK